MARTTDSSFDEKRQAEKPLLKAGVWRIWLVILVFIMLFATLAGRLVQLGFEHRQDQQLRTSAQKNQAVVRPEIHDRHGRLLALDVPTSSLYADPKILLDIDETVEKVAMVLPELDPAKLRAKLTTKRRFVWLRRHLTPDQRKAVFDLGLPGLYFLREQKRFYPVGAAAAHVVGTVDRDNKGLSGIERHIDEHVAVDEYGNVRTGKIAPIKLSMDLRVQHSVVRELQDAITLTKAQAGAGLVLDLRTGEVLALASLPSFDPQKSEQAQAPRRINRAMRGVYELGSVLKTFTIAMGLDEGAVKKGQRIDVATPITMGSYTIKDHHKTADGSLSIAEIFTHSSNVGAAKIAQKTGTQRHRAFLSRLQLLNRLHTEVGSAGRPLQPRKWTQTDSLSIAYGYRLSLSPLQLSACAMALFNGGNLVKPSFLKRRDEGGGNAGIPVLKSSTSAFMRHVMRANVKHGTGRAADAEGYRVGGKTGTARKVKKGAYSKQLITSFIAIFSKRITPLSHLCDAR